MPRSGHKTLSGEVGRGISRKATHSAPCFQCTGPAPWPQAPDVIMATTPMTARGPRAVMGARRPYPWVSSRTSWFWAPFGLRKVRRSASLMPSSAANSSTRPAALRARSRVMGLETLKLSRISSASCFVTARYFRVSTGIVLTKQYPMIGHAARPLAIPYHGRPAREYSPKVLLTIGTGAAAGAHGRDGPPHREAQLVVQRDEVALVAVPVDPARDDVDAVDLLGPDHGRWLLHGQQAQAQVPQLPAHLRERAACVQTELLVQAPVADTKDLGVALRAGGIDDQQVVALHRAAEHVLRDQHLARLAQQIAQLGGALELEVVRGAAQFGVHACQQLVARTAQEGTHLTHHRVVLLGADAAVARPEAAPERVAQARATVACAPGPPRF